MFKNNSYLKWVFLAILICFFFPFFTISCDNQQIKTFSGVNLVTGTTLKNSSSGKQEKIKPQGYAVVAVLAGALGLLINFLKTKQKEISSLIAGIVGFISLLLLKSDFTNQANQSQLSVGDRFGFYLTLILFIVALASSAYLIWQEKLGQLPSD